MLAALPSTTAVNAPPIYRILATQAKKMISLGKKTSSVRWLLTTRLQTPFYFICTLLWLGEPYVDHTEQILVDLKINVN
jgi:hypothetical protein